MADRQGLHEATRHGDAQMVATTTSGTVSDTRPHTITPIPIQDVTVDDAFWSPKRQTWQNITIRDAFRKFENDGALVNFDRVRDGCLGGHAGPPWYDGLIYEMIRGASDFLASAPDPALDAQLDGYIARIATAADRDPDGYVNTYTQLDEPEHRWGLNGGFERWQHDVYNAGALVEAGIHHHRATGKLSLLNVSVKLANHMCTFMGPSPKKQIVPSHSLPEEALVELFLLFQDNHDLKEKVAHEVDEARYLSLAEFWIEDRGHHVGKPDWETDGNTEAEQFIRGKGYGDGRPSWGAYAQDHKPVFEQETIEGHAVRATLLCTGVAAAARINGHAGYYEAAWRLWTNMVTRRMYITGGTGAFVEDEKFGADYVLPNNGYLETCAAVGAGFFHRNMNLAFGHARYVDELERVLYNGALAGVSLKGDTYTYENPLETERAQYSRWAWHKCPCCPPMFLKMMGALPGYIYATDAAGIYVNLFVGGSATVRHGGGTVSVQQTTPYPWEGRVTITVDPEDAAEFDVNVRIPGWSRGAALTVNGMPIPHVPMAYGYARLRRTWTHGDVIDLTLEMPIETVKAHPRVQANVGRVAIVRGPVVYCIESVDNGGQIQTLMLPERAHVVGEFREDMLGGVVVVRGEAQSNNELDWADRLYTPVDQTPPPRPITFTAVPYYAIANRGPAEIRVWIPASSNRRP